MADVVWSFNTQLPVSWMLGLVQYSGSLPGGSGANGWNPVLGLVVDGPRRVLRVTDWVGGSGAKPTTGSYVGPTGLVTDIAAATDVRGVEGDAGPQGPEGPALGDMLKSQYDPDGDGKVAAADAADQVPWSGVQGKPGTFPPATHTHDDLYAPASATAAALAGKSSVGHGHSIAELPVAASGQSNSTTLVRADDARLSDARTPVAHTHDDRYHTEAEIAALLAGKASNAHSHTIAELPIAASGEPSSAKLVLANDSRLSDARTPTAHTHLIADLPIAASGVVDATKLVRADDSRLSDARTPLAHHHGDLYFTQDQVTALLAGKAATTHTHTLAALPVATSGESSDTKLVRADDARLHTHSNLSVLAKIGESAGQPTWDGGPWPGGSETGSGAYLQLQSPDDGLTYRVFVRVYSNGKPYLSEPVQQGSGATETHLDLTSPDDPAGTYRTTVRLQGSKPYLRIVKL